MSVKVKVIDLSTFSRFTQHLTCVICCRSCAVFGGTYILGESSRIRSLEILAGSQPPAVRPKSTALEDDDPTAPPLASRPVRLRMDIPAFDGQEVTAGCLICPPDAESLSSIDLQVSPSGTSICRNNLVAIVTELPPSAKAVYLERSASSEEEGPSEEDDQKKDVFVLVLTSEGEEQVVRALFMGPATGSCPEGHCE